VATHQRSSLSNKGVITRKKGFIRLFLGR